MKLSDETEIDNYSIEQLVKLRDSLNSERLQKLQEIRQKQSEIIKLQNEVSKLQNDAIAKGDDVIAIAEKLNNAVKTARANN